MGASGASDVQRVRLHLHGDAPSAPKLVAEVDALADVLFDEPGFASLLSIIAIAPRFDIHDDTAVPYVAPL